MSLWADALRSRQTRWLGVVAAVALMWQGYLAWNAPNKIAQELMTGEGKVNVMVTLPFTPDRFHVIMMQRFGRVTGTQEHSIEVRGVPRSEIARLARHYWVSRVDQLQGD